jgi:hypothetical protein
LIDWKSSGECKGPFPDQKVRLSAYANLWNENNPPQRLDEYHLIILPKNGAGFKHCSWGTRELDTEWKLFLNYRAAYDLDKACATGTRKRAAKAEAKAAETKPRYRVKAQGSPVSMVDVLRAYGHVPEVRP